MECVLTARQFAISSDLLGDFTQET